MRRLRLQKPFEDLGWRDGMAVQFRLDSHGKIREITTGC